MKHALLVLLLAGVLVGVLRQAAAHEVAPEAVDDVAGEERVVPGGQPLGTGSDVALEPTVGRNGRKSQKFEEIVQWLHRLTTTKTQAPERRDRF